MIARVPYSHHERDRQFTARNRLPGRTGCSPRMQTCANLPRFLLASYCAGATLARRVEPKCTKLGALQRVAAALRLPHHMLPKPLLTLQGVDPVAATLP